MAPPIDTRAFYVKTNAPVPRIGRCLHLGPIEASAIAPLMSNRQSSFTAEERSASKRHIVFADSADLKRSQLSWSLPKLQPTMTDDSEDDADNNIILFDMDTPLLSHGSYQSQMHPHIDQPSDHVPKSYETWATIPLNKATHILRQSWNLVVFCCRQGKVLMVDCMSGSKLRRKRSNEGFEDGLDLKRMPRNVEY